MEQAKTYETLSQSQLGIMLRETQMAQLSHPVPVIRAQAIWQWSGSQEYSCLLENKHSEYNSKGLSKGGWRNW